MRTIAVHSPVQGFSDPTFWCATMVKFQQKLTSFSISPSSKKTSSGVNFPVLLHFASKNKTFTSKLALRVYFFQKKQSRRVPKKQVQTYHRKQNNQAFPVSPLPPLAPQHAESLLEGVNATPPGWKNRFQREWRCVKAALEGWKQTDSRTPNFFSAISLIHRYFWTSKSFRKGNKGSKKRQCLKETI